MYCCACAELERQLGLKANVVTLADYASKASVDFAQSQLDKHTVELLELNRDLNRIWDSTKNVNKKLDQTVVKLDNFILCSTCQQCNKQKPTVKCKQCDKVLCDSCDSELHHNEALQKHQRTALQTMTGLPSAAASTAGSGTAPAAAAQDKSTHGRGIKAGEADSWGDRCSRRCLR